MARHTFNITTALTALCALGVIGCSELSSSTGPSPVSNEGRTTASATLNVNMPAEDTFPVSAELAAVRRATARFHNISDAYAGGYTTENEPCVAIPAGAMGVHAPNFPLILDPEIDPLRPELLLYIPGPNGKLRLVGVEYFQAILLRNVQTGEVAPRLDAAPWNPAQFEVVNPAPELFGQHFHLTPPPAPQVPWHYSLHVWLWAHNPNGIFEEWNPTLSC